jgi:motility quorum-sensing regulator/GCU-specific mRNA interferase toxin
MEKRKPHYSLSQLQDMLADEHTRIITRKCKQEAAQIGYFDDEMIVERVLKLNRKEFDKSMTVYGNSQLWQDVYKSDDGEHSLYIKLQLSAGKDQAVVIQFKTNTGKEW